MGSVARVQLRRVAAHNLHHPGGAILSHALSRKLAQPVQHLHAHNMCARSHITQRAREQQREEAAAAADVESKRWGVVGAGRGAATCAATAPAADASTGDTTCSAADGAAIGTAVPAVIVESQHRAQVA